MHKTLRYIAATAPLPPHAAPFSDAAHSGTLFRDGVHKTDVMVSKSGEHGSVDGRVHVRGHEEDMVGCMVGHDEWRK